MPGDYKTGCGCVALILSILIGTPLAFIGIRNFNIRRANSEIKKARLKDLVTSPPETDLWVEVSGVPVNGSYMNGLGYMLLRDPESKVAVYLALGEAPPLLSKNDEPLVIRGMIEKDSPVVAALPKNLPGNNVSPDLKVAPLLLEKDSTPPSWLASWGLIMISAAMFAATTSIIQSRKR